MSNQISAMDLDGPSYYDLDESMKSGLLKDSIIKLLVKNRKMILIWNVKAKMHHKSRNEQVNCIEGT